jgi:hypothetical protein
VRLRARPLGTLQTGDQITAQAQIAFDENDPMWTNTVAYTIDLDPPEPSVALEGGSGSSSPPSDESPG